MNMELASLAAEVGINFDKAQHLIVYDGEWKNNVPALDKAHEGKGSLISSIAPNGTRTVTFKTLKGGGDKRSWSDKKEYSHDPAEAQRRIQKAQAKRAAKNQRLERNKALQSDQNIKDWEAATKIVGNDFPYLQKKRLADVDLKQMYGHDGRHFVAIPVINNDVMVGLQRIYADGEKRFTSGTQTKGSYYVVGGPLVPGEKFFIAEGWATAMTVHRLTGRPVVCAFNAGNLKPVVLELRRSHKAKNMTIVADNDQWKDTPNTGMMAALDIHYEHKIKVRFPTFNGVKIGDDQPTDFNDLYLIDPAEAARQLTTSRSNRLSIATTAFDYRLAALALAGKVLSPKNIRLVKFLLQALRKGYDEAKILGAIEKKAPHIAADIVREAMSAIKACLLRRTRRQHLIADQQPQKSESNTTFPLEKNQDGALVIPLNFYADHLADLKDAIIIVKTPMGTGKTEIVIKAAMDQATAGTYIAHRVCLVAEACQRLKIQFYQDNLPTNTPLTRETQETQKIGVCVNSLIHSKFGHGNSFLNNDVVCIDEATKVLQHLTGEAINDPEEVFEVLFSVINSAKQVIICDADASDYLIRHLTKYSTKKVHVFQATLPVNPIKVVLTSLEGAFNKVIAAGRKGEKMLIAADSKNDVEKIKRKLSEVNKDLKVLDVVADSKYRAEVMAWIKNPNTQSQKWDVVIYNSSVDSGLSITTNHFNHHIGIFRGVVCPLSAIQMMGRYRPGTTWYIGCSPIFDTHLSNSKAQRQKALQTAATAANHEALKDLPPLTKFDQFKLDMHQQDHSIRRDYFLTLKTILEQKDYNVEVKETEENLIKEMRKDLRQIGNKIRDELMNRILFAQPIFTDRYKELKKSEFISKEESAEIIRYEIAHSLGVPINLTHISDWLDGILNEIKFFEIMQGKEDDLAKFDAWEKSQTDSLTLRKYLVIQAQIFRKLFEILKIDRKTGLGRFTHKECKIFWDYLQSTDDYIFVWNYFRLGHHINIKKPPKDYTKVVQGCLKKMGLASSSELFGPERLSCHEVTRESWDKMTAYAAAREKIEQHVAKIPRLPVVETMVYPFALKEREDYTVDLPADDYDDFGSCGT